MKPDKKPEVIDFDRYKTAQAQVKAKEAARLKALAKSANKVAGGGGSESFLGSRPRAGLILVLFVVVLAALFLAPRFLGHGG